MVCAWLIPRQKPQKLLFGCPTCRRLRKKTRHAHRRKLYRRSTYNNRAGFLRRCWDCTQLVPVARNSKFRTSGIGRKERIDQSETVITSARGRYDANLGMKVDQVFISEFQSHLIVDTTTTQEGTIPSAPRGSHFFTFATPGDELMRSMNIASRVRTTGSHRCDVRKHRR